MPYKHQSIIKLIQLIGSNNIILPEIQRAFVWKDKEKIEQLFDSIYRGYPISVMLFWTASASELNQTKLPFYQLLKDYHEERSSIPANELCKILDSNNKYIVVLDGQQRLTALNIGLKGSVSYHIKNKPWRAVSGFSEQMLYFNSSISPSSTIEDEGDEKTEGKTFQFLKKDEKKVAYLVPMEQIYSWAVDSDEWKSFLATNSSLSQGQKKNIKHLIGLLNGEDENGSHDSQIQYYEMRGKNYDNVLNVFVRLNASGVPLTKAQLLFSTLTTNWHGGRKEIDTFLEKGLNELTKADFTRDWIMRFALMASGAPISMKVSSFDKEASVKIQNNWEKIKDALNNLSSFLGKKGYTKETIKSYNALMPIAYYLYKGGKLEIKTKNHIIDNTQGFSVFFAVSQLKNLFGASSNSVLEETRKAIDDISDPSKTPFTLAIFEKTQLTGGRRFAMEDKDLDVLFQQEKNTYTFMALSLLYPDFVFKDVIWHQDHLHPYALFTKKTLGSDKDKWDDAWLSMRNQLPNLQLLEGEDNEKKNKTPLLSWTQGKGLGSQNS